MGFRLGFPVSIGKFLPLSQHQLLVFRFGRFGAGLSQRRVGMPWRRSGRRWGFPSQGFPINLGALGKTEPDSRVRNAAQQALHAPSRQVGASHHEEYAQSHIEGALAWKIGFGETQQVRVAKVNEIGERRHVSSQKSGYGTRIESGFQGRPQLDEEHEGGHAENHHGPTVEMIGRPERFSMQNIQSEFAENQSEREKPEREGTVQAPAIKPGHEKVFVQGRMYAHETIKPMEENKMGVESGQAPTQRLKEKFHRSHKGHVEQYEPE